MDRWTERERRRERERAREREREREREKKRERAARTVAWLALCTVGRCKVGCTAPHRE